VTHHLVLCVVFLFAAVRRNPPSFLEPSEERVDLRRSKSLAIFKRAGFSNGNSAYIQYWERLLEYSLSYYGSKVEMRRSIAQLQASNPEIDAAAAFCALAHCRGSVGEACGKLQDPQFANEVKGACGIINVESFAGLRGAHTAECAVGVQLKKSSSNQVPVTSPKKAVANSSMILSWAPLQRKIPSDVDSRSRSMRNTKKTYAESLRSTVDTSMSASLPDIRGRELALKQRQTMRELSSIGVNTSNRNSVESLIDQVMQKEREQLASNAKHAELVIRVDAWGNAEKVKQDQRVPPFRSTGQELYSPCFL